MMNMEKLLDKLKKAKLRTPKPSYFEQYLYDLDVKDVWKNKKAYAIVNEFYAAKYELWQNRLIKRIFYVQQCWNNKEKEYCNIYEVQRFLAGSPRKLNKWIYSASFGGVRNKYWTSYESSEWEANDVDRMVCTSFSNYSRSIGFHYMNGYSSFLKQSEHKYSGFEFSGLGENQLFWYLYQYEKHPQMEMIAKMGLMDVVLGSINCLRWSQKGYKLLGIENKGEIEKVRMCQSFGGLKFYRKHCEDIKKYALNSEHRLRIYMILYDRKYSCISKKLIDYIDSQDSANKYYTCAGEYIDYIDMCNHLGIPITSKIKYPDVLKEAHDEVNKRIIVIQNEDKDKKILNLVIKKLFKYRFADDDFVITPANSIQDLIDESKELYHCVKTYAEKYSKGETAIFLIRKREDVLTPYFTLELKNSKINQVRGSHNCNPDNKVKDFVLKWAKRFRFDTKIYQSY